ncbi:hypothetical protein ABK040_009631 [Willaertia magna]
MMLQAKINDECLKLYNDLKMSKGTFSNKRFLVVKMEGGFIEIDQELSNNYDTFEALTNALPENHARYIFYHLEFEIPKNAINNMNGCAYSEGTRSKMMLVTWNPSKTSVREKFQTAGTSHFLKQNFNGIFLSVQACSLDEITREELVGKCLAYVK